MPILSFTLLTDPPEANRGVPDRARLGLVSSIDWSVTGLLATGGTDSVVRIWDPSGAMLAELATNNEVTMSRGHPMARAWRWRIGP